MSGTLTNHQSRIPRPPFKDKTLHASASAHNGVLMLQGLLYVCCISIALVPDTARSTPLDPVSDCGAGLRSHHDAAACGVLTENHSTLVRCALPAAFVIACHDTCSCVLIAANALPRNVHCSSAHTEAVHQWHLLSQHASAANPQQVHFCFADLVLCTLSSALISVCHLHFDNCAEYSACI
jgi:hypothetical protein